MANLVRRMWNPASEMLALSEAMDQLLRNAFVAPMRVLEGGFEEPAVDVMETKDAYIVKAALPGWKAENVDVTFENGRLVLSGEWKEENVQQDEHTRWHCKEINYKSFQRTITLPLEVEPEKAKAEFENGVLTLTVPKAEVVKPKQIKIAVK